MTLVARGYTRPLWQQAVKAATEQGARVPREDVCLVAEVNGPEPGYDATSKMVVAAALTVLEDAASMPAGGVLTPAAAFGRTRLLERLNNVGVTFTVRR